VKEVKKKSAFAPLRTYRGKLDTFCDNSVWPIIFLWTWPQACDANAIRCKKS